MKVAFDYWIQRQGRTVGACMMEVVDNPISNLIYRIDGRRFFSTVNFVSLFARQQEGKITKDTKLKPLLFWIFFCLNDGTMVYKFDESHKPFAFDFDKDVLVVEIPAMLTHRLTGD